MARPIRIEYEEAFYHGAARGDGQSMICNWSEKGLNRSGLNCPESRAEPFTFTYFTTRKQVLKMAGLDLNANRSGKRSDAATPVLSKKGKADLRYALYQAGFVASSKNRHFIAYYTTKLRGREKEKGIETKMRVKLAAKMLIIAWTLMKRKKPFDPDYLKAE